MAKYLNLLVMFLSAIQASPFSAIPSPNTTTHYKNLCVENADRGIQADRGISAFCDPILNPSPDLYKSCKPVSLSKAEKMGTADIDSFLSLGVRQMNDQLTSHTSRNSKLGRAVFIMGTSDSDKRLLAQILSRPLNGLHATYTENGSLFIIDVENPTQNPSENIIPDYLVNPDNKVAFWNCPSFDETRDPEMDIAGKYFLQTALDLTITAKFIFTVNYIDLKNENDGKELDLLATNVISLFRNVSKFADSIGLVVTQAERYTSEGRYKNNRQIFDEIQKSVKLFLDTKKEQLKNETVFEQRSELEKKIQFVEGLLGGTSEKLYFAGIPEKCGPLGEMTPILNLKHKITEICQRKLAYASVSSNDFQFTLKNDSYIRLNGDFIPKTLAKVEKVAFDVALDLNTRFQENFYGTLEENLEESLSILKRTTLVVAKIESLYIGNTSTSDYDPTKMYLSKQVEKVYQELGLKMKCTSILIFLELENRMAFFAKLTHHNDPLSMLFSVVKNRLIEFNEQLGHLTEFYDYCNTTKHELTHYPQQKLLESLSDKLDNDAKLIENISRGNITSQSPSQLLSWNTTKLEDKKFLAKLVRQLIPKTEVKCVNSYLKSGQKHLIFSGKNVKLSDILNKTKWPELCKQSNIAEVSVLASERVYIDTDIYPRGSENQIQAYKIVLVKGLETVSQLHISIVAPKWIVIGRRHISLNGFQPFPMEPAKSGKYSSENGKPGRAGLAGGNAGSFFGIYSSIHGAKLLKISAKGGQGGNGQKGGNGQVGQRGSNVGWDDLPYSGYFSLCNPYKDNLRFGFGGRDVRDMTKTDFASEIVKCVYSEDLYSYMERYDHYYTMFGSEGGVGGNGGKGGQGGPAGLEGKVEIFHLKSKPDFSNGTIITTETGTFGCGDPGQGGLGGRGGQPGDFYSCQYFSKWYYYSCKNGPDFYSVDGNTGQKGDHCSILFRPLVPLFMPWQVINEYRATFFGENSHLFDDFLRELDSNEETNAQMSAKAFAFELEKIEGKFFEKGNEVISEHQQQAFIKYFEKFYDRINKYTVKNFNSDHVAAAEEKIALNIIFSTVLSKIVSLRRQENQLNVIKTREYFESLISQMTILKASQKQKSIGEESKKFKRKLDEKVREANNLIETFVNPAIENAYRELEKTNDKLVQEINEYLNAAEDDLKKKIELKKQLEAAWLSNLILGIFSFVGAVVSMLGPKGQAVGAVINIGVGIAKSIIGSPSVTEEDYHTIDLPTGFQKSVSGASDKYYINQLIFLDEQTTRVSEAVGNATGNSLQGVKSMAVGTREGIESLKKSIAEKKGKMDFGDVSKFNEVEKSYDQMQETVEKVGEHIDDLSGHLDTVSEKLAEEESKQTEEAAVKSSKSDIAKGIGATLKIGQSAVKLANTIIVGQKGVSRMERAIEEAKQSIKAIKAKKTQFYDEILPTLDLINEQLDEETRSLRGQSQVGLSVKKWKIKGILKNMRGFLTQFTQAMKVTEVFKRCFDTLDEALTLLIELYDHIERYEEKKDLADFIANVNAASDWTQISDMELREVLTRLDFFNSANLFLEDYQKGIHALKQWAFPFANRYLNETKPGELTNNLPTVISTYRKQVEDLSIALKRYEATTVEGDQYSMVSFFTSDAVSSEPFYRWTNDNWQNSIKKLLAGEPIHLKADVDMFGQESASFFKTKSAIKFKSLAAVLKTRNESRQAELDETLNHFHMAMTHSGISLYKVMEQHFVMHDRSITYHYSFEKTKDNNHVTVNGVKYKVDGPGADFLMSPYTWWTFQISDAKDGGLELKDLAQFEEEVDLELEGNGVYLEETRVSPQILSDLKLAENYEVYDSRSNWGFNEEVNKDICIVSRSDMMQEDEILAQDTLSYNDELDESNFVNVVIILALVGGVGLLLSLGFWYANKNGLLGCLAIFDGSY